MPPSTQPPPDDSPGPRAHPRPDLDRGVRSDGSADVTPDGAVAGAVDAAVDGVVDGAVRERVACYVVRDLGDELELLVFDHVDFPDAGTQVPAGGMDPGESVSEAATREVSEECGLTTVAVVRELGKSDRPHAETGRAQHTTYVLVTTTDARPGWTWRVGGNGEDEGLLFRCWFTPLPLDGVELSGHQDEFLGTL